MNGYEFNWLVWESGGGIQQPISLISSCFEKVRDLSAMRTLSHASFSRMLWKLGGKIGRAKNRKLSATNPAA